MEKIEFENNLFEAIKKDDLKSFAFLMQSNSDLNICYGRFPILSLLYLYSSFKILSKYEKFLMPIHNFKIVDEKFDIYKAFKTRAKKSVRFFEDGKTVYPILMLAVLDEKIILKNNFKFLYKNEEILQILSKIYKINYNLTVKSNAEKIDIPNQRLQVKHNVLFSVIMGICAVIIALSSIMIAFVSNNIGFGTVKKPIKITTANEFVQALKNGDMVYTLTNDIVIGGGNVANKFSGTIDCDGHSVTIEGDIDSPLIKNLTGTIKNLKIKLSENQIKITQNCSIISEKLSGNIENCEISGKFDANFDCNGDAFFGLFASENSGTISNCKTYISGNAINAGETNAYLANFVGVNLENGKIENSESVSGIVVADTVDIAGIAAQNYGEISLCENNATLLQSSGKLWHPNIAGIALTNYGKISSCVNNGELNAESTLSETGENIFYVFVGGIACDNYAQIVGCKNYGELIGKGNVSNVAIGGIVEQNIKNDSYEGAIETSFAKGDITAKSLTGQVVVGGVVGVNGSIVLTSGFVGNIDANSGAVTNKQIFANKVDKPVTVFAGGVVGVNQESVVQKCYASAKFINQTASEDVYKLYGGVIGYVGIIKFKLGDKDYSGTYDGLLTNVEYMGSALSYVVSNFYVADESIKQNAFGVFGILYQSNRQLYYGSGKLKDVTDDLLSSLYKNSVLIKSCSNFDEIKTKLEIVYE